MATVNPMFQPEEKDWSAYRGENTEGEHRSAWRTVFILLLMLCLGAAAYYGYYGYSAWNKQNMQIGQLAGSQGAISTLGQRVDSTETKLRELNGGWASVGQRMTNVQAKMESELRQTRRYAETLNQQLHQQISAELETRTSALDIRLRQVEAEQTAQRSQMAQVQADLKQNMDQQIRSVKEQTGRDLSDVRQQADANSRDVNALSQRLDRKRVDFEVSKGQTKELVPGMTLKISGTNATYQRYHGLLWLVQDRRTLWLKDQSVHEPVRFFHKQGGDPYELVVTDVTKKAAIGYLLVPMQSNAEVAPGQREAMAAPDHE